MKINEKIYSLRKQKGLSQEELANKLNVSRQTVSKWETGESSPDFDKIVPLCELFEISTEELLRDRKIEGTLEEKVDTKKALMISISVMLYIASIIAILIGEEYLHLNDGLVVSIFFGIIAIATGLLVYTCMTRGRKKTNVVKKKNPVLDCIIGVTAIITVGIYLLISFTTGLWHITWIIWLIFAIVVRIIKLVFYLKGEDNNEE